MIQNILNEYQIKETIGKGTFSKVKLCNIIYIGYLFFFKIIKLY